MFYNNNDKRYLLNVMLFCLLHYLFIIFSNSHYTVKFTLLLLKYLNDFV